MEPTISLNYLAIAACVIVAMVTGSLWFGPLFGKAWARHMGMSDAPQPSGGEMGKSLVLFAVSSLLIAYVFAHGLEVWRASSWGLSPDVSNVTLAASGAFFTWLGFFLPIQIGRVAWEQKRWGLVAINSGYDLARLALFAVILTYWR